MNRDIIEDKIKRWSEQKYSEKGNRSVMEKDPAKKEKKAEVKQKPEEKVPNVVDLTQPEEKPSDSSRS
jgi:hypothetical protein